MRPRMVVIAGPPGSGKSTAFPVDSFGVDFFNADDRAAQLNGGSYQNISIELRALINREFEQFVFAHIKQQKSFAIETTLRSDVTFQQAAQARATGFEVHMRYITLGEFKTILNALSREPDRVATPPRLSSSAAFIRRVWGTCRERSARCLY
jgi:predicted ABC-type ATPase